MTNKSKGGIGSTIKVGSDYCVTPYMLFCENTIYKLISFSRTLPSYIIYLIKLLNGRNKLLLESSHQLCSLFQFKLNYCQMLIFTICQT